MVRTCDGGRTMKNVRPKNTTRAQLGIVRSANDEGSDERDETHKRDLAEYARLGKGLVSDAPIAALCSHGVGVYDADQIMCMLEELPMQVRVIRCAAAHDEEQSSLSAGDVQAALF